MLKRTFAAALVGLACLLVPILVNAQSYTFKVLASFSGSSGTIPLAGLIADSQGNLFGTTQFGGANNKGTVFELPVGSSTPVALGSFDGTNGANPVGGLVADGMGNLFGVAPQGGANGLGTLFEYTAASHNLAAVASFDGTYGSFPKPPLIADSNGNLFGSTSHGGTSGQGNIFKLPAGSHTPINLASFATGTGPRVPEASLIFDRQGNLFGTTQLGGPDNNGTIFELPAGTNTPVALANFDGTNGAFPDAGLIADAHGNHFGVAQGGGPAGEEDGDGTIFELPAGTSTIVPLANFTSPNGNAPLGNLFADSHGNLFGTTNIGGAHGDGTVFELPAGSSMPITLVDFDGSNGEFPEDGLVADAHGNLFGTAPGGGANSDGVIFELARTNIPGDYNANGTVDAADYVVWRKTLGQSGTGLAADGNNNGMIDTGDFDVWRAHFGQTVGSGAGVSANAAVPEPATAVLLMFAAAVQGLRRRRGA